MLSDNQVLAAIPNETSQTVRRRSSEFVVQRTVMGHHHCMPKHADTGISDFDTELHWWPVIPGAVLSDASKRETPPAGA